MDTATLTPAQQRMFDAIGSGRVELRQSRYDGTYYWEDDHKRLPAATGRVIDKLCDMGLVSTRRLPVQVEGMNVPRTAILAYIIEGK